MMEAEERFRELARKVGELAPAKVEELADLHERKNADYGDAYGTVARKLGLPSALTPLNYKMERLNSLADPKKKEHNFESIGDSFIDMAAYCIMAHILFEEGTFK